MHDGSMEVARTGGLRAAKRSLLLAGILTGFGVASAHAKETVVEMRNQSGNAVMVFEPAYVAAAVGDTIRFIPTDPGHDAEPIAGMLPDGVVAAAGQMGKEYVLKLSKAGLYGIKCGPHFSLGMVALIKAGKHAAPNAAAVTAAAAQLPIVARRHMQTLLAEVK